MTGEVRPAYLRWRSEKLGPFLAKMVGTPTGRAEVEDLHATIGRFLGLERARQPALKSRERVKHCSCAYCRAHRGAPKHGPYFVREFWDASADKWRDVPKGRKGWVRRKTAPEPDELPREATPKDLERIRAALVND